MGGTCLIVIEIDSDGMIYITGFMTLGSGVQLILSFLPQEFERLRLRCYRWEGFMMYANKVGSGAMIYLPSFIKIGSEFRSC
jgi:hypothetical protein